MANLENFDLQGHLSNNENKTTVDQRDAFPPVQRFSDSNDYEQIRRLVNEIVSRCIDITEGYLQWRNAGYALKDALGEQGRAFFHDISRMNPQYSYEDCDKMYTSLMKGSGSGIHAATLFQMAKDAGIDISEVSKVCAKNAKVPNGTKKEKKLIIKENVNLCENVPSCTLAQVTQSTFSDKLRREDIPSFLWPVFDSQDDAIGRDKMLLGTLNVISGLLPESLYSIYDRRKVHAPLYNIIYGRFATSKGDLEAVRQIAAPMKMEMRRQYEAEHKEYDEAMAQWEAKSKKERGPEPKEPVLRSPFISANSSSSAVYRALDANGGSGMMFETESDTMAIMLSKSEYGDYTDLLRKAHHHEEASMRRVSEHIDITIEKPRLSVFLTCTGSQLPLLLPAGNVSNGLASRFLFYALPDAAVHFRDVFAKCDKPIEDEYKALGQQLLPLYHALQMREEHPIQFIMTKSQQQEFVETFDAVLHEQFSMLGDGIQGYIFRLALECYRYSMILTALRKLSEWDAEDSLFDSDEQALVCDERDFHTAMTIINCLVNHTGRVYAVIGANDNDPFSKVAEKPSEELKAYYKALPDGREFKTAEAIEIAAKLSIPERTAKRLLGDMLTKYLVINHPRHGIYVKSQNNKNNE